MPLSLQTTAPPAWLHSELAPSAEHCPPSGTVFCARAVRGAPIGNHAAANVAASPLSTLRRDVPAATARARSSNRNPSMLASYSSSPPEAADPDSPLPRRLVGHRQCRGSVPHRTAEPGMAFAQRGARTSLLFMSTQDGAAAFPPEKRGSSQAIIGPPVPECQHRADAPWLSVHGSHVER